MASSPGVDSGYVTAEQRREMEAESKRAQEQDDARRVVQDVVAQMKFSHACAGGHLDAAKEMADGRDAELLAAPDLSGLRPLHHAAINGQAHVIEWLVGSGADVNGPTAQEPHNTPLISAAVNGQVRAVTALVRLGADVAVTNKDGHTAFDLAKTFGCISVARVLKRSESPSGGGQPQPERGQTAAASASMRPWAPDPSADLPVPIPSLQPGVYPGPLQVTFSVPGFVIDEPPGPDDEDPVDAARRAGAGEEECKAVAERMSRVVTVRATAVASSSVLEGEPVLPTRPLVLASPKDEALVGLWKAGRMPELAAPPPGALAGDGSGLLSSQPGSMSFVLPEAVGGTGHGEHSYGGEEQEETGAGDAATPRLLPADAEAERMARVALPGSSSAEAGVVVEMYDKEEAGDSRQGEGAVGAHGTVPDLGIRPEGALWGAPRGAGYAGGRRVESGAPIFSSSAESDEMVILRGEASGNTRIEGEPVKQGDGGRRARGLDDEGLLPVAESDTEEDDDDDDGDDDDGDDASPRDDGSMIDGASDWSSVRGDREAPHTRVLYDADAEQRRKAKAEAAAREQRGVARVTLPPPGKPHTVFVRAVAECRDGRVSAVGVYRFGLLRPLQHFFRVILPPQMAKHEGRLAAAVGSASLDDAVAVPPRRLRRRLKALGVRKGDRDRLIRAMRPLRDAAGHGEGMRPYLLAVARAEQERADAAAAAPRTTSSASGAPRGSRG